MRSWRPGLTTSTNLYLASEITGYDVTEDHLRLNAADGGYYTIPLGMLGYFRAPYAPDADAELLILRKLPTVAQVSVTDKALIVSFADGRVLSAPLHWFPRLLHGTPAERRAVEIWGKTGLHWEALDEDIDAVGLFKMTGPSVESEASIQHWLTQRSERQVDQELEALNAAYVALREDPAVWQQLKEERSAWDATLLDGLEE